MNDYIKAGCGTLLEDGTPMWAHRPRTQEEKHSKQKIEEWFRQKAIDREKAKRR